MSGADIRLGETPGIASLIGVHMPLNNGEQYRSSNRCEGVCHLFMLEPASRGDVMNLHGVLS